MPIKKYKCELCSGNCEYEYASSEYTMDFPVKDCLFIGKADWKLISESTEGGEDENTTPDTD